jgi:peptidyl-prolyl cis-trans isomerase-like 3
MALTLHTSAGDLKLELSCAQVPKLCENFLALAAAGAYDNTSFHRNIKGFAIQGGDPTGTGKGGSAIAGGHLPDEFASSLRHDSRGVVAMANRGPNTNGSQFYICYAPQAHLDDVSSVIGRVIGGSDVLDRLEQAEVGAKYRPVKDITINRVTIHANPFARP